MKMVFKLFKAERDWFGLMQHLLHVHSNLSTAIEKKGAIKAKQFRVALGEWRELPKGSKFIASQ